MPSKGEILSLVASLINKLLPHINNQRSFMVPFYQISDRILDYFDQNEVFDNRL